MNNASRNKLKVLIELEKSYKLNTLFLISCCIPSHQMVVWESFSDPLLWIKCICFFSRLIFRIKHTQFFFLKMTTLLKYCCKTAHQHNRKFWKKNPTTLIHYISEYSSFYFQNTHFYIICLHMFVTFSVTFT